MGKPLDYAELGVWHLIYKYFKRSSIKKKLTKAVFKTARLQLKRGVKRSTQALLSLLSVFLANPGRLPGSNEVRQIVVLGDMGIGNFVMLTPLLRALRQYFREAEIVVLFVKNRGADQVAARLETVDRIVRIFEICERQTLNTAVFLRAIGRCNLAPQLLVGRFNGSVFLPLLALALRPAWRVGHISSAGFVGVCDSVFNIGVPMQVNEHEVERNLKLAWALGVPVSGCGLEFPLSPDDIAAAQMLSVSRGLNLERLICLQVGSSEIQKWKRWPADSWSELMCMLASAGWCLALLGSKEERDLAAKIAFISGVDCVNLCGELSLGATAALMKSARLLICNDSGLMHIAAAVGIPIIGLFGPTEYDRTRPWSKQFVGFRGPCACNAGTLFDRATLKRIESCNRPCLAATTSNQVMNEVTKMLGQL